MAIVQGIASWASIQAPNTTYEHQYCIDLEISEDDAERLRAEGVTVKESNVGKPLVKFKRKVKRADGEENPKPIVVDVDNMPFDKLVGNGSIVNVQYRTFDWTYAGKTGVSADLVGVQVLKHEAYGGSEFEAVDGSKKEAKEPISTEITEESPFSDE